MKKIIVMAMAGVMALSMVACGKQADTAAQTAEEPVAEAEQTTESQPEETTQIANPWHDITEEEANAIVPMLFKVPEGAANVQWSKCDSASEDSLPGELVQATFDLDNLSYTARAQVTGDNYDDISGAYYDWTVSDECTLANWGDGNMTGNTYRFIGDSETVDVITWYDVEIGISYSLSTSAADLDGFDIQAVAEGMFDETKVFGYDEPEDEYEEHVPMDITGCDTFTQIVDKLENGQAYANTTIGGEDVLLVTGYTFDGDGKPEAIDAEIYKYTDGAPQYIGYVECGGTAYPLGVKDELLFVGSNHWVKKYTIAAGGLAIDEEASVEYDTNGDATYFHHSDLRDVGADSEGKVADDSAMTAMYEDYMGAEIIEFSVVNK